jgi:hypothetical protein
MALARVRRPRLQRRRARGSPDSAKPTLALRARWPASMRAGHAHVCARGAHGPRAQRGIIRHDVPPAERGRGARSHHGHVRGVPPGAGAQFGKRAARPGPLPQHERPRNHALPTARPCVCRMIMVDNQGSFLDGSVAWPFAESDWDGLSPADCVFPTVRWLCVAGSGPQLPVQASRKPHRLALARASTSVPTLLPRHFTAVHLHCWTLYGAGAGPRVARCSARRHRLVSPYPRIGHAAAPG